MNVACIVAFAHLRYDGVWQRPQQILSRLAERLPVLYVEEPFVASTDADELRSHDGVTVLRPKRRPSARAPAGDGAGFIDAHATASIERFVAGRRPLLWFYQPMMFPIARAFARAPVVYDCMDELAAFDFAPAGLAEQERALEQRATLVFAGGRSIYERRRALGPRLRLYPSGVDVAHFARAAELPRPQLLASLPSPVCTYVGVIDERIDVAPILALAERGASVVLVGPIVKIDPARLPRHQNVHFTGRVPYAELPALLAGTDVAIMPFARNDATRSISPTKTPEYLAARRPVVSTEIADVVAAYGEVVRVTNDADHFAEACFAAARATDPARVARGLALARNASWAGIVTNMWHDLERELSPA